jgi:hypothetical protein
MNGNGRSDFDESLLEQNLQMTLEERLIAHDSALEVALEFKRAGRELYRGKNVLETEGASADVQ